MSLISVRNVQKHYRLERADAPALIDVSLDVMPGERVCLMGPSGSGKSTLLNLIGCIDTPTAGTVIVDGEDTSGLSDARLSEFRNRRMGFIFQSFNLIPSWTAGQNVEAALIHTPLTRSERDRKVRDMLQGLELGDHIDYLPSELSVGQQQRVAIARALIHAPAIVFADEPTGDVDPDTAAAIMDCLVGLVRNNGTTLILCTHGELPHEVADRRYLLRDGTVEPA
jgi:putative ABC transport system ATP-binding protein